METPVKNSTLTSGCNTAAPACADYLPTAGAAALRQRAEILRRLRRFFEERDFLEVQTPLLTEGCVVERHIDPVPVLLLTDPRQPSEGRQMWLQTSPEAAMKRLLTAGAESIYQITQCFRVGEEGPLHNPEFTMAEWYQVGANYRQGQQLLSDLTDEILHRGSAERMVYAEAFGEYANIDPHRASNEQLARRCRELDYQIESADQVERDSMLEILLVELVQPQLGQGRPVILFDFPASQAALARVRQGDLPVAERFELFVDGIELANGYHELADAAELRRRFAQANDERYADGKYRVPEDARLLAAMDRGLPHCTGCALGVDRLMMIAADARQLDEVIAFPIHRA